MVIINPAPNLTENYLWIPEGITDNVVPGLGDLLTYTQSEYATLASLQNSITNLNTTMKNELQNLQSETDNIEITSPQNVSKESHYHTSHTDFMYQRSNTNNDNRRSYIVQNQYFTYQRKSNTNELELMIQTLQQQVNEMQIQINNLGSESSGGGGGDIGTMW